MTNTPVENIVFVVAFAVELVFCLGFFIGYYFGGKHMHKRCFPGRQGQDFVDALKSSEDTSRAPYRGVFGRHPCDYGTGPG
jgi:hypothetical protein